MGTESEDNWCSPFLYETKSDECEICGKPHEIEKCDLLKCSIEQVKDTCTPSYARLTLPDGLEVRELLDGTTNVVTTKPFRKGVQFGPFIAKTSGLMDVRIEFPIKVFLSEDDSVYLESYEELFCNWMCLVPPASNNQEQNLFCYQIGTSIYFCTIRDIEKGQELKVWYSPYYGEKMGVQSFSKQPDLIHSSDEEFQEIYTALQKEAEVQDHTYIPKLKNKRRRKLPKPPILGENYYRAIPPNDVLPGELLGAVERKGEWHCKECGQVETNVAAYARHLMEHYRNSTVKTLSCPLCPKRFRKDGYSRRIHIEICKEKQTQKELEQCSTTPNESGKSNEKSLHLEILAGRETEKDVTKTSKDNLEEGLLSLENISSAILSEQHTDSNSLALTCVTPSLCNVLDVRIKDNPQDTLITQSNFDSKKTKDSNVHDPRSLTSTQLEELPAAFGNKDSQNLPNENKTDKCEWNSVCLENKVESLENLKLLESLNVGEKNNWTKESKSFESERNIGLESLEENLLTKSLILDLSDDLDFNISKSFVEMINEDCNLDKPLSFPKSKSSELFCSMPGPSLLMPETPMAQPSILDSTPYYSLGKSGFLQSSFTSCDDVTDEERNRIVENLLSETDEKYLDYEMTDGCVSDSACNNENRTEMEQTVDELSKGKSKNEGHFKCDICAKCFGKQTYLFRHLRKHTGEFRCNACFMVFARKETLQTHKLSCSSEAPTQEAMTRTRVHCKICRQDYHSLAALRAHMEAHYCQGETWKCECKKVSDDPSLIENHGCTRSSVSVKCVACCRTYSSTEEFVNHKNRIVMKKKSKHKDFSTICEICGAVFKSRTGVRLHRINAHGTKNHECPICGKKFSRSDIMLEHKLIHEQKSWECAECKKQFSSQKRYKNHLRVVHSNITFMCQYCDKVFRQKGNLLKHVKLHKPRAQIPCTFCDKQFTSKENHENHMKTHLNKPLYQCSLCDKNLVTVWQLKTHIRRAHNEMYKCVYCNMNIRYRHTLKKHLMSKHRDKTEEWDSPGALKAMMERKPEKSLFHGKERNESGDPGSSSVKDILQTVTDSIMNEDTDDGDGVENKKKHRKLPNIIRQSSTQSTITSSTENPDQNLSSLQLVTLNIGPVTGTSDGTELLPSDVPEGLINLPLAVINDLQIVSQSTTSQPVSPIGMADNLDLQQIPESAGLGSNLDGALVNFPFTLPEGFQLALSDSLTEKYEGVPEENSTLISVNDLQGIDSTSAFVLTDGSIVQPNLPTENNVLFYIIGETESNLL
ncbi:uncharacterized protein LOC124357058 isoform X1 [Homalodisca vitripennis]|uniref:uncharacterized protein LOC124357058 isoform X1 n=1 Tax=Homalodisca vitripennis TaxID=197043 RepID=UPI001EEBF797|nr:uncharacterized protein LOC124357058 isoform X1 [Homalodisca vitripennis]